MRRPEWVHHWTTYVYAESCADALARLGELFPGCVIVTAHAGLDDGRVNYRELRNRKLPAVRLGIEPEPEPGLKLERWEVTA